MPSAFPPATTSRKSFWLCASAMSEPHTMMVRASACHRFANPGREIWRRGAQRARARDLDARLRGEHEPPGGRTLGITEGTVRIHMTNVMVKLGVKRRT